MSELFGNFQFLRSDFFLKDKEILQECDDNFQILRILKHFSTSVNTAFYFHVICIKDFWFSLIKIYGLSTF